MRRLRRRPDPDVTPETESTEPDETVEPEPAMVEEHAVVEPRWTPADLLVVVAGAGLAAIGLVALNRVDIDSTWYTPVVEVGGIEQTPLLAAIAVGVGAVLVILGIAGARAFAAFVLVAVAICAAVVAVDPGLVERELALDRDWAFVLVAAAGVLALLALLPWPVAERSRRRSTFMRRGHRRTAHQH
jgi:hypothetical protein